MKYPKGILKPVSVKTLTIQHDVKLVEKEYAPSKVIWQIDYLPASGQIMITSSSVTGKKSIGL